MILNKALLLKGLGGVTALGGSVGAVCCGVYFFNNSSPEIIKNTGLDCGTPSESGSNCTIDTTKLKVNQDNTKTEGFSGKSGSGKIKLYKLSGEDTGYKDNFKFVIEEGDITLTTSSTTTTKLEELETYEIEEEGTDPNKKYYLKRKDKASQKIKELLGLPNTCDLDAGCSEKEINTSELKAINFEGKDNTTTVSGSATLTITKLSTPDSHFPLNYKFEFKGKDSSATINLGNSKTITLETNKAKEFRIKKISDNKLTLEEAWSLENLAKEVNLTCTDNTCTQIPNKTTNVKQDSSIYDNKTLTTSGSGKIKVYTTDTTNYNKDFRFVIEGGDVSTSEGTSQKLEEFETYEIKKDSDKWYFSRKDKAAEGIKKALGLDGIDNCNLPTDANNTSTCSNIDVSKLKKINFDGKGTDGATVTSGTSPTLKISITSGQEKTHFPFGYKFAFESNEDITISSSPSNKIKKNTNTEFKIKATTAENTTARTLTLEKAWDISKWGQKIGLTNCSETGGQKQCDLGEKINLYVSDSDKTEDMTITDKNKKIKYEEDVEGHNQGFKFTVSEDIALNSTGNKKIEKNSANGSPTYEIKEDGGKWYLAKKTTS